MKPCCPKTDTRSGVLEIVAYFGVIYFESLWPINGRCLEQFHIAHSLNRESQCDRLVGLQFGIGDTAADIELTYTSAESRWFTRRQFRYMDSDARSGEWLGDRGVTTKEIIKDTTHLCAILHTEYSFELCGVNRDIATALREE